MVGVDTTESAFRFTYEVLYYADLSRSYHKIASPASGLINWYQVSLGLSTNPFKLETTIIRVLFVPESGKY